MAAAQGDYFRDPWRYDFIVQALNVIAVADNPDNVELANTNSYAVDISGWKLTGGVQFTFYGGTVIPSNGVLYVSPDLKAFRSRTSGPRGA